jgi:predicted PurR-regulated permease PerM
MDKINNEQLKRVLAYAGILLFSLFILFELRGFITTFLGAVIFYVIFKNLMSNLVNKRKWNPSLAASLIILISFFIILIPILTLSYLLYSKIVIVINDPQSLISLLDMFDKKVFALTGVEIFTSENMTALKAQAGNLIPSLLGQTFWIIGSIVMMYFVLYFMLVKSDKLSDEINTALPFNIENIQLFARELENITLSNAIGVPLIGLAQGTAAGLGYWALGLQEPVFWGAITALVAFIPFAGTAIVWLPSSIFLVASGNTWQGIVLAIYCVAVVVNIDTIARFKILKKFANVHPLITVFGVIIGMNLFGLPGLIFGPLMLSYLVISVKLYREIYKVEE